jgi:L-lactate dehydrogenase complex protein LldF
MTTSAANKIDTFVAEATRAGSVVYQAKPDDVSTYILDVAKKHDMKNVVKSKSLLANRIGLTKSLQERGLDVKETDIGEWLNQSKGSVKQLPKDPEKFVEDIRLTLRELYINGDIGISEAQVGVAETGTLILASNEGNDRLASLLPKLHITLIDRRNIVAMWEEAIIKMRELYKDKNGWRLPSFVTYLTGRNTTGDIPGAMRARAQGPEEEHIVIVDIP